MPRQYRALACRCGICDPSASAAGLPGQRLRDRLVPGRERQPYRVPEQVLDLAEVVRAAVERGREHGERTGEVAVLLAVERPGEDQRRDRPLARAAARAVRSPPSWARAVVGSFRWKLISAVMPRSSHAAPGSFRSVGTAESSYKRVIPAPDLEVQLTEHAVRLGQPDRRADLVGELPGPLRCGERLVVPVEVEERCGLVDLEQQPEVGQRQGRSRSRRDPARTAGSASAKSPRISGPERQHVQRPAGRPGVTDLRGRGERALGLPVGCLQIAQELVGARGEHEQPGAVLGREPGGGRAPGRAL